MRTSLLFLLAACSNPTRVVGEDPADTVVASQAPVLVHLSSSMALSDATVADLFADDLAFDSAPDPMDWLRSERDDHAALPDGSGPSLSVLTFNAGLLNRTYLLSRVEVPFAEERAAVMGQTVFTAGYDVVFLQEVWEVEDAERIAGAAREEGYTVARPDEDKLQRETGLLMAVRSALVEGDLDVQTVQYDAQWGSENFPGPNLKRGYLHGTFTMAESGESVHLYDTHLTPFYDKWQTRNLQVRELGLAIADVEESALVLVGGDFNAGWYYAEDTWSDAEGEDYGGWWRNPTMPALLSYYAGVTDLANLAELADEVGQGYAVPTNANTDWFEQPFGNEALCESPSHFTATDCNSLYWTSYAATEFPARMDLLFVRDGTGRLRARSRSLAFVDPIDIAGAGEVELSDHYGQAVTVELVAAQDGQ